MNFFPMNAGGGGNLEKTLLWTNPSPTSSLSGSTNVTLNDRWDNYDFIEVDFKAYNTYDNSCLSPIIFDMSHYAEGAYGSAKAHTGTSNYGLTGANYTWWSNADYYRGFRLYDEDTNHNIIKFFHCYKIGTAETGNNCCIPVFIYGIKKTSSGGGGTIEPQTLAETSLWTNSNPTSSFSAQTVTLSDDIDNYDFIGVYYKYVYNLAIDNDPQTTIMSVADFKTCLRSNSTKHNIFTFGGIQNASNLTYTRNMYYESDTQVYISTCSQLAGSSTTNDNSIPLQIIGYKKSPASGSASLKDLYRSIVINNPNNYNAFGLEPMVVSGETRSRINEGRIVIDTENHTCYLYCDFTCLVSKTSSAGWGVCQSSSDFSSTYLPYTTSRATGLTTDSGSTVPTKGFKFYYYNTTYGSIIEIDTKNASQGTFTTGDRYIVYGSWEY